MKRLIKNTYLLIKFQSLRIKFNDIRDFNTLSFDFQEYIKKHTKYNINPLWVVLRRGVLYDDISQFIKRIRKMEREWVIDYYLSLNPTTYSVFSLLSSINTHFPQLMEYFRKSCPNSTKIGNLIISNKLYQTKEMVDWFKSRYPMNIDILWLIVSCEYCQNDDMLKYFIDRITHFKDYESLRLLMTNCNKYNTKEMFELYLSFNPNYHNFSDLITNNPSYQKEEYIDMYLNMKPNARNVLKLMENCVFCRNNSKIVDYFKSLNLSDKLLNRYNVLMERGF